MPDVIDPLRLRRATRAFDPRPVPADLLQALWQAISLSPSHGNSQPTRIVAVAAEPERAGLNAALSAGNTGWASLAPLLAVIAADPGHDAIQGGSDGSVRELWQFHAGLATAHLLAQATAMGLTAHPMAGFDEPAVRAALGIPESVRVLAIVAIGYPGDAATLPEDLQARETAPQRRLPLVNLVSEGRWDPRQSESWKAIRDRK